MPENEPKDYIKFRCPGCSQKIKAEKQFTTRYLQCPSCQDMIQIPVADGPSEAHVHLPKLTIDNEQNDPWANDASSMSNIAPTADEAPTKSQD